MIFYKPVNNLLRKYDFPVRRYERFEEHLVLLRKYNFSFKNMST